MISLAHKFLNLGFQGYASDRRPQYDEYTDLNWDSQHAQDLLACWPMWGPSGADVIVDLTPYHVKAYQVNEGSDPYVWDDQFGWVYQGDNGGVPHGGGSPTKSSGYEIKVYPNHLDRGYMTATGATARSLSFTVWFRALDRNGQRILGSDLTTADVPPNAYFCTFDCPSTPPGSFPGFGWAIAAPAQGVANLVAEVDVDGSANQATIVGNVPINDGQWHHLTGVYQVPNPANAGANSGGQGRMFLYIDGLVDTDDTTGGAGGVNPVLTPALSSPLDVGGTAPAIAWKFYIGVDDDGTAAPMNGRFCDLRIYGTDLTPAEALHMWTPDSRWELYRPRRYYSVQAAPAVVAGRLSRAGSLEGLGGVGQKAFNPTLAGV